MVVVIIFLLDNVLRSILVSGRTAVSTPLVFFFILGGIHFFGLVGVLYGPLILLALYILSYIWPCRIPAEDNNAGSKP